MQVDDTMHGSGRCTRTAAALVRALSSIWNSQSCTLYLAGPQAQLRVLPLLSESLSRAACRCDAPVAHCVPSLGSRVKMSCTLQNAVGTAHVHVYLSALLAHAACAALALTRASLPPICHTCAVCRRKCDALAPLGATTRTSCLSPRAPPPAPGTLHPSAWSMSSSAQ